MAPIRRSSRLAPPSRTSPPWETLPLTQLIQQRCRERVLVDPLEWTDVHLELLQCRFEEAPSTRLRKEHEDKVDKMLLPPKYPRAVEALSTDEKAWGRESLIRTIISSNGSPLFRGGDPIAFQYNRTLVRELPGCQGFISSRYSRDEAWRTAWKAPIALVTIDREALELHRFEQMEPYRGRRWSQANRGVHLRHVRRITPSNRLRDPYLVAILIAIAAQQREKTTSRIRSKASYWPQVLMTDRGDECVHLFAAHISSDYLNKFDFPSSEPPKSAQHPLVVHHLPLQIKPYDTFRRRLLTILLHPAEYYTGVPGPKSSRPVWLR
ncbi:hypothetical protein HDV57DRAFT_493806 [Trichoderma longibrachiatum]|uniref:Uncharacterized protein n=1 Tax=Trichoderma longibrachiatum ATCC 18648 TaxID=983965 RepID=A0A2T4CGB9_TRILO|nr:hypothetical protein M440DRAFT_358879 [Trichoderma longibrachiatum ATCC 18648]